MKGRIIFSCVMAVGIFTMVGCGDATNVKTVSAIDEEVVAEVQEIAKTIVEEQEENTESVVEEIHETEIEIIPDEVVATASNQPAPEPNKLDGKVTEEDFRIIINNCEVILGTDINEILSSLGKADSVATARSCIDDGEEKQFVYGDYVLYTYPSGAKDIIYLVEFGETAVTDANIGIGSTREDVQKAYGNQIEWMGEYEIYELSMESSISIIYVDDVVTYIDMYYK